MAKRDGELSSEAAARLQAHLAECLDCARVCAALEAALQSADVWGVEGSDVWERVAREIARESPVSAMTDPLASDFAEPLAGVLAELVALRKEMHNLRIEVQMLRAELAARQPRSAPRAMPEARPPLLPYTAYPESRLRLV